MQILIFLIEVVLIFFLVDMEKISTKKNTTTQNTEYTSYYIFDESGNTLLMLNSLPKEQKVIVWQGSSIKDEMMESFPNISTMSEIINSKIEDNGTFKQNLIDYMEYIQGEYLAGNITQKEFKEALEHPDPSLPSY